MEHVLSTTKGNETITAVAIRGALSLNYQGRTVNIGLEGLRLSEEYGIEFLPCLEFDTVYIDYDLHILGYFVDYTSPDCGAWMEEIFEAKLGQTRKRVEKLAGLGFSIDFDEVMRISEGRLPTGATYVKALSGKPENKEDPRVRAFIDGDRSDSPSVNFYLDYLKAGRPAFVPQFQFP